MVPNEPCADPGARILSGRSVVVGHRGFHLWGSAAPVVGNQQNYVDGTTESQVWAGCKVGRGLFQITSTVNEYVRNPEGGTLFPLPQPADGQAPAGIDPATHRSQVQLRVSANDGVAQRNFEMDAGQSICVVAQDVCVQWRAPANTVDVSNLNATQIAALGRTGLVIDSFLGVAASRIEATPGDNATALLTRHLYVPAATRGSIEIPAYAKSVTIYQEPTLGTSSVMWTQCYGNPNGASGFLTIAALPFIVGQRRTQPDSTLSNASFLWTDLDPDFARFFTLVFTIRP